MVVRIVPSEGPGPEEKLADCELVFEDGLLAGMKLVGFSIWRGRRSVLPAVTFPSRTFQVNGERRSYALLRPESAAGTRAQEVLRAAILQAFGEYESRPVQTGDVSERAHAVEAEDLSRSNDAAHTGGVAQTGVARIGGAVQSDDIVRTGGAVLPRGVVQTGDGGHTADVAQPSGSERDLSDAVASEASAVRSGSVDDRQ